MVNGKTETCKLYWIILIYVQYLYIRIFVHWVHWREVVQDRSLQENNSLLTIDRCLDSIEHSFVDLRHRSDLDLRHQSDFRMYFVHLDW